MNDEPRGPKLERRFTKREAAAIIGIKSTKLKELMAAREIDFEKHGTGPRSRVYFTESALAAYLRRVVTEFPSVHTAEMRAAQTAFEKTLRMREKPPKKRKRSDP